VPLAGRPYFIPGENITWDVSFAGIHGGRARLAVGAIGDEDGRRLVILRAEAESSGVVSLLRETHDSIASWIDADTGLPTRTEASSSGAGRPVVVHTERVRGAPMASLRIWSSSSKSGEEGARKQQKLPSMDTHDPLSVLLALRSWAAPLGGHTTVYSLGGLRVWKNLFVVEGSEEIEGPLGKRQATKIRGVSTRVTAALTDDTSRPPRTFTVWFSEDAQRIPVRFTAHTEFGDVVAQATSYTTAN
jgi:hypothetical protein